MKKKFLLPILFLSLSLSGYAQKNIFSVPLAEMVERGNWYIQPEATISGQIQLSSIFTYGIGGKFQAGISVRDITVAYQSSDNVFPYEEVSPGDNPDVMANLQTGFDIGNNFKLGLGTRSGANIASRGSDFSSFNYLNLQANVLGNSKIVVGGYYGNDTYVVRGNNEGFMAGVEVPLGSDKFKLLGDYISGINARSMINLGFGIKLGQKWNLALGAQLPTPDSGNSHGGLIQFHN